MPRTAAVLLVLAALTGAPLEADTTLTPEMLVGLKTVGDVTLDPGGEHVAYVLQVPRTADEPPGDPWRELWVAELGNGETRRFSRGEERVASPSFTPDGKRLAFLVKREDVDPNTQVYLMRTRGGEAKPLTRHATSIAAFRFSPDGERLAFVAAEGETEEEKEAKRRGFDMKVVDADPKFRHLWLFDVKKKDAWKLVGGERNVLDFAWAPDGKTIVFKATETVRIDDEYMRSQLYAVETEGGEPRRIVETPGKLGAMAVSPDGTRLAFLGAVSWNDPLAQSLFVVPLAGGEARNLTEGFEASAEDLAWHDDGTLFLVAVQGSRQALYHVDAATGERRRLDGPGLVVADFDLAPAHDLLVMAAHAPTHPGALYAAKADGAGARRLDDHQPELRDVRLAKQEVVTWTGAEGWTIEGVLTYPLDYTSGERYPLVLQVHGGPEGVSLDGWTTSAGYPVQLLAAAGFMVLQPNYRGSMGRGVAFSQADHDDLGGKEYDDVLAGVDALAERGLVDPERVGTGGWSYGGYLSAWAATRWSERFQASVVGAGLTNWVSFSGTTDIPVEMSAVHWDSWWFDEPELHWQRSPLAHLNKAQTPTLILHGEEDARVHPEQGLELYTGLRLKGVPTALVLYPRAGHGLTERAHQLDAIARVIDWYKRYLTVPNVEGIRQPID